MDLSLWTQSVQSSLLAAPASVLSIVFFNP